MSVAPLKRARHLERHRALTLPTKGELAVLSTLWTHGPAGVREVREAVNAGRVKPLAPTTVLRFLQIMTAKGLVVRTRKGRADIYRMSVPKEETQRQLLCDLLDRVFDGSVRDLIFHAIPNRRSGRRLGRGRVPST